MAVFALTVINGPNYNDSRPRREQERWTEHAAFMDRLVADGVVILGGPIGDGTHVLVVVEAADEPQVRTLLAGDPWEPMGILRIGAIQPWTIWLDGRRQVTG
ncbi:MAG TPA: YciI family protein [Streptosporangiaceae bacterium]|nr:YciI family protein [Streptosporangiaceae bacterium]